MYVTPKIGAKTCMKSETNEMNRAEVEKFNKEHYGLKIMKWRVDAGLTQAGLARALGVTPPYIGHWENGRARPDFNIIPRLCEVLKITPSEFFGMEDKRSFEEQSMLTLFRSMSPADKKRFMDIGKVLVRHHEEEEEQVSRKPAAYLRLLRNAQPVCAGIFNPLDSDDDGEYVMVVKNRETEQADEIITVSGDSMEPTFHDGDELLVKHTQEIGIGEIGIFVINGDGFVKELRYNGVYSHNAAKYPFRKFVDGDEVRCVGRVVGVLDKEDYM